MKFSLGVALLSVAFLSVASAFAPSKSAVSIVDRFVKLLLENHVMLFAFAQAF